MKITHTLTALIVLISVAVAQQQAPNPNGRTVAERLGYPANARLLVIHADDFGMDHSVNRAIMQALENRWVTSASILVPCPWFPEAAKFAKEHPHADLGIHLALNSEWTPFRWGPVSAKDRVPSLLDRDGYLPLVETQVVKQARIPEVEVELRAQIEKARAAGVNITHFDTHMGTVVDSADLFRTYLNAGQAYRMPVLLERRPDFFGIKVDPAMILTDKVVEITPGVPPDQWTAWYEKTLAALPPGSYQLIVHLAYDDEEMRGATYDHPDYGAAWRQRDFDMVRSPAFQQFLKQQGFVLVSWRELARALPSNSATSTGP
jgi:predicted glycoside hydrolase/deacetylase ChbG (UPF0249 family)